MTDQIKDSLEDACASSPRDFTEEEKQYLLDCIENDPTYCDELISWFQSTASDGCWTDENLQFMQRLQEGDSHDFQMAEFFDDIGYPLVTACSCGELSRAECAEFCLRQHPTLGRYLEPTYLEPTFEFEDYG